MLSNILGYFWIFFGLLWLWKPHLLRTRAGRKTARKVKWPLFIFTLFLTGNLLNVVFTFKSIFVKIAGVIGIFFMLKAILGLTSKATGTFLSRWSDLPLFVFRVIACFSILAGVLLARA